MDEVLKVTLALGDGVTRHALSEEFAEAGANLGGLFARAPAGLRWLRANPHAVPGEIPERLDRAGLVARVPGEDREVRYSACGANPYRE